MTVELEAEQNEWPPRTREDDLVVRMYTWGSCRGWRDRRLDVKYVCGLREF